MIHGTTAKAVIGILVKPRDVVVSSNLAKRASRATPTIL